MFQILYRHLFKNSPCNNIALAIGLKDFLQLSHWGGAWTVFRRSVLSAWRCNDAHVSTTMSLFCKKFFKRVQRFDRTVAICLFEGLYTIVSLGWSKNFFRRWVLSAWRCNDAHVSTTMKPFCNKFFTRVQRFDRLLTCLTLSLVWLGEMVKYLS